MVLHFRNNGFTDDNNEWLKPKGKNLLDDEDDDLEDDVMGDDFGEGNEEEGSDSNASEESDESGESDDDEGEGGDELPIEKKARKLKKKQAKDAKIAEEELQLNFAEREVFQLPSGQEVDQVRFFKSILGPIHITRSFCIQIFIC